MKKYRIFIIIFIVGLCLGYFFKTSKTITKKVEVDKQSTLQLVEDLKIQISTLESTNTKLQENITEKTTVTEKPDGSKVTIIEKETNRIEYESKIKETQRLYESQISKLQQENEKLKEFNKVEINKKKLIVEVGYTLSREFYGHANYQIYGSVIVGAHVQVGTVKYSGIGIGLAL